MSATPRETIEESTPPEKQIHLIIDNYAAHKHANVRQWLSEHPRFHVTGQPSPDCTDRDRRADDPKRTLFPVQEWR